MEKLKLAAGMTGEQKRYAVEAALLLGFQTETATFPVITADGEIPVPENMEELKALWKKSTGEVPEEYESASKHTGPIFDLDFRKEKGLETMLQKGDFLKDENQDLLPDVLDVKIVLPEDADDAMLVAACNLAWRFGMETTGYKGNITADAWFKLVGIKHPIAKGLAMGTAAHAIGTAKALEMGEAEGAMSSLSIAVAGLMTVVAAPLMAGLI